MFRSRGALSGAPIAGVCPQIGDRAPTGPSCAWTALASLVVALVAAVGLAAPAALAQPAAPAPAAAAATEAATVEPDADSLAPAPSPIPPSCLATETRDAPARPAGDAPDRGPRDLGDALRCKEAPVRWEAFAIRGDLVEPVQTLREVLEPKMQDPRRNPWDCESREQLAAFTQTVGYDLLDVGFNHGANGTEIALTLAPVTLVRKVHVNVRDNFSFDNILGSLIERVFEDEIIRRMSVRQGSPLPRGRTERNELLAVEAERIKNYLNDEGYFEAKVTVTDVTDGPHSRLLEVVINKGVRYRLGEITVRGNQLIADDEIVEMFRHARLCVGKTCVRAPRYSRQALNRDIQRVIKRYQRRGYPAVRVRTDFDRQPRYDASTKTVSFAIIVNERRKIDVVFEGNLGDSFREDKLRSLLSFDEEGSYDDVEIETSAAALRSYYQSRGYFQATVAYQRVPLGPFDRIVFSIDQGPRLKVRRIEFEGNVKISSDELAKQIKTRVFPSTTSSFFRSGGYATSVQIEQDVARIARYYRSKGFTGVRVRARVSPNRDVAGNAAALAATVAAGTEAEGLYIKFIIETGIQNYVEAVLTNGLATLSRQEVLAVTGLAAGEPFDERKLTEAKKKLERHYFQNAHPQAQVQIQCKVGSGTGQLLVQIDVVERQRIQFGNVLIRGNFKTRDWVILSELGFDENAPLSLSRAEIGQQNLRNSGLFTSVNVDFIDLKDSPDPTVDVIVNVEERYDHRAELEFAAGYSSDNGGIIESAVISHNMFGIGLRGDIRLQSSVLDGGGNGGFGNEFLSGEGRLIAPPWIARRAVGLSFRSELAVFARREDTERFGELRSGGFSTAFSKLGRRGFFRGWQVSLRYDLRLRNRDEDLVRGPGASDDLDSTVVSTRTGAIGPQLIIDKRTDSKGQFNPLVPEAGFKLDLRALLAHDFLLGQDRFIKLGASGQHFWKLGSRLVISNGIRYDHGIPLGGDVVLPEVERFFAGGDTTVRGFDEDRLATEIIEEPLPPLGNVSQLQVLPAGGNIRFIHNLDLQVQVWRLGGFPVASALFLDTGLVTNSLRGFEPGDLRHAIGLSLIRLVVPFGSMSFEYAIPLDPQLGDDPRGRWHFNFGLMF